MDMDGDGCRCAHGVRAVNVRRRFAYSWLALGVVVTVAGLHYANRTDVLARRPSPGLGDVTIYAATVARLQAGESYYAAVGAELRRGEYATWPLMNWRTPLHYTTVAAIGITRSGYVLAAVAMAMIAIGLIAFADRSLATIFWAAFLLIGAALPAFFGRPYGVLMPEVWAGLLMGVSLGAYYRQWWNVAAAFGIVAVFVRELAVPYGVVCGLLAMRARRRPESALWIAGGIAYTIYYALHVSRAAAAVQPTDWSNAESWVRWQGLPFLLETFRCYGWLLLLPSWVTSLALGAACFAMAAPSMPCQVRAASLVYACLFLMIGQSFDFYWGFVTAPIWAYVLSHIGESVVITIAPDQLGATR
jgi:hypothetical protein